MANTCKTTGNTPSGAEELVQGDPLLCPVSKDQLIWVINGQRCTAKTMGILTPQTNQPTDMASETHLLCALEGAE